MAKSDHIFRALIADGDAALREQLERLCDSIGLASTTVASIDDGNAAIEGSPFDLIVTDWVLSGGSGIDLASKALDRRPGCGVIVLGVTGSLSLANNLLHGEVGAFVKKPAKDESVLLEALKNVLEDVKKRPVVDARSDSGKAPVSAGGATLDAGIDHPPTDADQPPVEEPDLREKQMSEERIKSLPATGTERMDAALEREQALVVDESEVESLSAGLDDAFDGAFDGLDDEAKTRPVQALGLQTDQEESSESDRAFRIRFRSVPGFTDANGEGADGGTQEEATDDPPTDPHQNQALADDDDEPMEISDEDFQMVDDGDVEPVEAPAPSASAEATVVFASNPAEPSLAVPASDVADATPKTPTKKKKRRRKAPPPSVGTSTVVTSIVARPSPPSEEDAKPSIVVREASRPNAPAPGEKTTTVVAKGDAKNPLPGPSANRIDTLGSGFEAKTVTASALTMAAAEKEREAVATDAVALPPKNLAKSRGDDAVALPSKNLAKSRGDDAVALPSTKAKADAAVALPAPSNKRDVLPKPPKQTAGAQATTAATPPPEAKEQREPPAAIRSDRSSAPVSDPGFSAEDLKDLNAAVGGAESAAVAFASDVAGAFNKSGGNDDEVSFTIEFDEVEPEASSTEGTEKTWVVNTQSLGVVSAELNDEVWTLNQPAEKTGIHVLEDVEHYAIERKLAEGKHASVYLARWPGDATPVALKVLSPELSEDIAFRQRFRREIRSQAALSHENVVGVVRYGRRNRSYFLAVELMEGTLQDILRALGRLPTAVVCIVLEDVLRGVHYAHRRQVIHREIKPSNVFFAADGMAKVGDFGFAKSVIDPNQSTPGLKLGTPAYFSPEQSMGKDLGPRSDLFAIGTLCYEMLTGKNPYKRDTIVDTAFAVTRAGAPEPAAVLPSPHNLLSAVVRRLGSKEPADRYQSALEALEDLAPLVALIKKRYPKLRSQFVHAPKDVARQLNADEARLEVNRASRMMSWGDSHRPRAALCYFRAATLDPSNADAKKGLRELETTYGMTFKGVVKKKYGDLEQSLLDDPDNAFLLRELADRAREEGDIWGYARFLRRLLTLDSTDQRARNQLDSLIGVDPAAPFGKGRPNPKEKTQIASPKLGQLARTERTGVGLRVPLENKTKLTQAVQER